MADKCGFSYQGDKPRPAGDDSSLDLLASQSGSSDDTRSSTNDVQFLGQRGPPPKEPPSSSSSDGDSTCLSAEVADKENAKPKRTEAEQRNHVMQKAASRSGHNVPHPETQSPKHKRVDLLGLDRRQLLRQHGSTSSCCRD